MKVEAKSDGFIHVVAENKMEHCIITGLFEGDSGGQLDIKIGDKVVKSMPIILDDVDTLEADK